MPQFVLNADGDEETPVDDALVLAVRYSYRGVCVATSCVFVEQSNVHWVV